MARSQAEIDRREGRYQVEAQREAILEAAERVFLEKGLERAQMVDIAAQAGITKVTLYRYFANLDAVALEVQVGSGVYSFVYAAG
jgi:TetR/AcrR family transcriptional repressor of mexJK operon